MLSESNEGAPAPDWYPDPSHRHDLRYWNGNVWTSDVSNAGSASVDPVFTDPDAELIGVHRRSDSPERTGTCHWRDVPHRELWEASLAQSEAPRIASWAGLLATDRALLVAEKWPAAHLGHYTKLGDHVDRYDFADISDVDEDGFDYAGSRKALSWKRDDKAHFPSNYVGTPNGFLWVLLAQRPELAPKLLVQQSEMGTSPLRTIKIGHLVSGSGYNVGGGVPGTQAVSIQQQYAVGTVNVVAQRDSSLHNGDYCQFVSCPVCGTQLRLQIHGEKIEICNPGSREGSAGGYATVFQVHKIDPS
ncbi:MAG: DUF2510 domain-containing protein [Candidatus Nanopelagicales bacterium]